MIHLADGSRILEHRYVMQNHMGRKLERNEVVHHRDNNGKNNSVKNLELMTLSEHSSKHGQARFVPLVRVKCAQCGKVVFQEARKFRFYRKRGFKKFCSRQCSGKFGSDLYWGIF